MLPIKTAFPLLLSSVVFSAGAFAAPLATAAGLFDAPLRDMAGFVSALVDQRAAA